MKTVKITLEISSTGYTQKVEYNGKQYTKIMKKTPLGSEGAGTKGLPNFINENLGRPDDIMRKLK